MPKTYRIFNQWRSLGSDNWCFVPFSVWGSKDFIGFVVMNFCFEWARTPDAKKIQQSDFYSHGRDHNYRRVC